MGAGNREDTVETGKLSFEIFLVFSDAKIHAFSPLQRWIGHRSLTDSMNMTKTETRRLHS